MTINNNGELLLTVFLALIVLFSSLASVPALAQRQPQAINSAEDLATYQKKSSFIKEFSVPVQERGLGGITSDASGNIWLMHSTNKTNTVLKLDVDTGKFSQYAIEGNTAADNAIINLAASQLLYDRASDAIWFTNARTNSIGKLGIANNKVDLWKIPTEKVGPMGIALSPDGKSIWFAEITGNKIGKFDTESKQFSEYPTGEGTGPALLTFDDKGVLWVSLSFAGSILRVEPWALIPNSPSPSLSGMSKIALPEPDRFSPFGIAVAGGKIYVSDHGSSRIVAADADSSFRSYTSYWTSPSDNFPTTLPSQVISDRQGNVYFAQHGGNRIAEIRASDGLMTEYEIPTGPLSTILYLAEGLNGKIWFVEWAPNRVAYLDTSIKVPFELKPEGSPVTLGAGGSKSLDAKVLPQSSSIKASQIEISLTGMSESGLKGVSYVANPSRIDLRNVVTNASSAESVVKLETQQGAKSGNYTIMVRASAQENDGLVVSSLYPLQLTLDIPQSANQGQAAGAPAAHAGGAPPLLDTTRMLALAAAAGLIGFIVYRRIKERKTATNKG